MKNLTFILLITILFNQGCEKFARHEYYFKFQNSSNQIIECYPSFILPDTMLPLEKPNFIEINSGNTGYIFGDDCNDPGFIRIKTEKLTIFVLSKDTLDKYPWSYFRHNYAILKRYEVTEKDIINMGGSIVFP